MYLLLMHQPKNYLNCALRLLLQTIFCLIFLVCVSTKCLPVFSFLDSSFEWCVLLLIQQPLTGNIMPLITSPFVLEEYSDLTSHTVHDSGYSTQIQLLELRT